MGSVWPLSLHIFISSLTVIRKMHINDVYGSLSLCVSVGDNRGCWGWPEPGTRWKQTGTTRSCHLTCSYPAQTLAVFQAC